MNPPPPAIPWITNEIADFARVDAAAVEPLFDALLAANRAEIEALASRDGATDWAGFIEPLLALDDRLALAWAPVRHLNGVASTPELRAAHNAVVEKLAGYGAELAQHEGLHRRYRVLADDPGFAEFDPARRALVEHALRDFHLGGVDLPPAQKARAREIQQALAAAGARFDENLLEATHAFRHFASAAEIAGLPSNAVAAAADAARREGREGWLLTLELPSYLAVMTHADSRALRELFYGAYLTRASDQGPDAGRFDNTALIARMLDLRREYARLLGFADYAEYSLATKMAQDGDEVLAFLRHLAAYARPKAEQELAELAAFAREELGVAELQPWDIAWASEKLRQRRHSLSQEELKPYFPAGRVVQGLFAIVERLFGLHVVAREGVPVWHEDVRYYEVLDADGAPRGGFYLDLYARPRKRGGAWMDECRSRLRRADGVRLPIAFLTCNLSPPAGGAPALFTHQEVQTLLHEFGHGLHHLLTRIDWPPVGGINGVEWDAVELPSQFLEHWCWEREALDLMAAHHETGAPMPDDLYRRLRATRNFQVGMQTVRQLEFALFDFRLHREHDPERGARVRETLEEVRAEVAVIRPPEWTRFANGFAHIFSGGYCAGYYSYKWAEVLAADAFALFEERGVLDGASGARFREAILERGGSRPARTLFEDFRGRAPDPDALLRRGGML